MIDEAGEAGAPTQGIRWPAAAGLAGLGVLLMVVVGAVFVPSGRFALQAVYGIVDRAVLIPLGFALPRNAGFVLANVAIAVAALAAGRRVGAVLAHQSVRSRVGSTRIATAAACIAGAAGAAAFAAAAPWAAPSEPAAAWPYRAGLAVLGYGLPLVALAVGPVRGVSRYLRSHPHCLTCWEWMQRESGGGAFTEEDEHQLAEALASDRFDDLGGLEVEARDSPGRSFTLQWWECPSCRGEAYLTCVAVEGGEAGAAVLSKRVVGAPVRRLRALVVHRRSLQSRLPPRYG